MLFGFAPGTGSANQVSPGITQRFSFKTACSGHDFRLWLPAWTFTGGNDEAALNQVITWKASLVPLTGAGANHFYPLAFRGQRSVSVDPWSMAVTDPLGIYLAKGTTVAVRVNFSTVSSAGQYPQGCKQGGSGVNVSNDGFMAGDVVDSGTFTTADPTHAFGAPFVSCVPSNWPVQSWGAVGDSVTVGQGDDTVAFSSSWFTRAVDAVAPGLRVASQSDTAQQYAINQRSRVLRFADFLTHAAVLLGSNDLYNLSRTAVQLEADLVSGVYVPLASRGVEITACTLKPRNSSSDSWATLANQTTLAAEPQRLAFNAWVRDGLPLTGALAPAPAGASGALRTGQYGHPVARWIDCAATVESSLNSGKWLVNGSANYATVDGAHPSPAGHQLVSAALSPLLVAAK